MNYLADLYTMQALARVDIVGKNSAFYDSDDQLHRADGPALEYEDGTKIWYHHGMIHREDGPAYTAPGIEIWYNHGLIHRVDGPAVIAPDHTAWYYNGYLHRTGGPAYRSNYVVAWYFHGRPIRPPTKEESVDTHNAIRDRLTAQYGDNVEFQYENSA